MTRTPVCASLVAQTEPGRLGLIVCPGMNKVYAVARVEPDGWVERVSEHDTPEEACAAKLSAAIAAAKARADLADIAKATA